MSLDALAAVLNIFASLAVIATLGFLAVQVQHNSRMARMSAAQSSAQMLTANFARVIESQDFADLIARESYDDLTPAQMLRVTNFLSAGFRYFEVLHAHQRNGAYEEELWHAARNRIRAQLEDEAVRLWWEQNRTYYAKSFGVFIDATIAEVGGASVNMTNRVLEPIGKPLRPG
ncbi:MAG: hypothetical protein AAFX03_09230 [Pseudomonadota bacterium]